MKKWPANQLKSKGGAVPFRFFFPDPFFLPIDFRFFYFLPNLFKKKLNTFLITCVIFITFLAQGHIFIYF